MVNDLLIFCLEVVRTTMPAFFLEMSSRYHTKTNGFRKELLSKSQEVYHSLCRLIGLSRTLLSWPNTQGRLSIQSIICLETNILSSHEKRSQKIREWPFVNLQLPLSFYSGTKLDQKFLRHKVTWRLNSSWATKAELLSAWSYQESTDWASLPDSGTTRDRQDCNICKYSVPFGSSDKTTSVGVCSFKCSGWHVGSENPWDRSQCASFLLEVKRKRFIWCWVVDVTLETTSP